MEQVLPPQLRWSASLRTPRIYRLHAEMAQNVSNKAAGIFRRAP
jgi:hypothetical protein